MLNVLCVFASGLPWVPKANKSESYWSSPWLQPSCLAYNTPHVRISSYSVFCKWTGELSITRASDVFTDVISGSRVTLIFLP